MKTVKYETTLLIGIIFFLLVSCDNFIHEIIPPNDNLITSFTLEGQSGKTTVIGENTITIPWNEGISLYEATYHVSLSPKATLLPLTDGYIGAAFPGNVTSDVINQISTATDRELTGVLRKLIEDTPNFKMPSLSIPIDFSRPVTFLVISGRDGQIRRYTVNVTVIVTFVSNGGSEVNTVTVNYGETVSRPNPNPTKADHGFDGWYTDDTTFYNEWDFDNDIVTASDLVLYARWTKNPPGTFTVTFDSKGGSPVPDQIVRRGETAEEPNDVTKEGHSLEGWYIEAAFENKWNFAEDIVTQAVTLHAKWVPNVYTITYRDIGDEPFSGIHGQGAPITYTFGTGATLVNPEEKTGYTFGGWFEDRDCEGTPLFSIAAMRYENIILYAQWTLKQYIVSFIPNGGTPAPAQQPVNHGYTVTPPTGMIKTSYTFDGWYAEATFNTKWNFDTKVTNDITLHAKWNPITYIIEYKNPADETQAMPNSTHTYDDPGKLRENTFVNDGNEFAGWARTPDGVVESFTTKDSIQNLIISKGGNPVPLYAVWVAVGTPSYTVIYNTDGGSGGEKMEPSNFYRGRYYNLERNSVLPPLGHDFGGWSEGSGGETVYEDQAKVMDLAPAGGTKTLYAKWTPKVYTITYRDVGDKPFSGTHGPDAPDTHTYDEETTLVAPTKEGNTFEGWFGKSDGTGDRLESPIKTGYTDDIILYAKWSCTVTFNKNNTDSGSTEANPSTKTVTTPATNVIPLLEVPMRPDWTFTGWNTEPDGSGTDFTATTTVTRSITVYAQWSCTVTFDKNNNDPGSTEVNPRVKKVIAPATNVGALPADPTRPGWTFNGWNTKPDGSGTDFTATTIVTRSIIVYAQWSCTVIFDKNNADGTVADPSTKTVITPETTVVTLPADPTRPDWTFIGWNTEPDGSGTVFIATTTVTRSITVYAQWSCTVTFNKNNTDGTEADPSTETVITPKTTVATLPVAPTRPDWTFAGWNTKADGSGTDFTATTTVTRSITVYAQWSCTVTFDKNNNDPGSTEVKPRVKTVIAPATNIDMLPTEPTRPGWTFNGWNTKPDGSGTAFTAATTVTRSITVYAQWSCIVTFDKNNTDGTEANPPTKPVTAPATNIDMLPTEPTRSDWTFIGWNTEANGSGTAFTVATTVTRSITVYAQWSCTVTFSKNNTDTGSTEASPPTKTVTTSKTNVGTLPAEPTRPGWNFIRWNTEPDGSGTDFTAITTVTGSIIVYAQWSCTVTFNKNNTDTGSTEADPSRKTVTTPETTVVTLPAEPTRPGWTFIGWNTKPDGKGTAFIATTTVTGNITVYAQWSCIVTFNKNNTNTGSIEASPQTKTVTAPAANIDKLPDAPTRPNWTFIGWNTKPDGKGTAFDAGTTVTGNITVYAQWSCTVIFSKNNADGTEADPRTKTVTTPETTVVTLPAEPTRPGWTFAGWKTQNGTAFTATTTVTGNITVYAQWSCIVTFNKNNTDGTEASPRTKPVTTPSMTVVTLPIEPIRPGGWTFDGWNTKADGSGTPFTAATPVTGNITVYAQWIGSGSGGTPWFIVFRVVDAAPLLEPIIISRSGTSTSVPPRTVTITVDDSPYTSVTWNIHSTSISVTGKSITLDAANSYYNNIGVHSLTVVAVKDGISYNRTITFEVVR